MSDLQRLKRHLSLKSIEAGSLTFEDFLGKLKEPRKSRTRLRRSLCAPSRVVEWSKSRRSLSNDRGISVSCSPCGFPPGRHSITFAAVRLLSVAFSVTWRLPPPTVCSSARRSSSSGDLHVARASSRTPSRRPSRVSLFTPWTGVPPMKTRSTCSSCSPTSSFPRWPRNWRWMTPKESPCSLSFTSPALRAAHCYSKLMFDSEGKAVAEPDLGAMNIKMLRLSSRTFGISTWGQADGGCSLVESIKTGSSGIVDIPELCAVQTAPARHDPADRCPHRSHGRSSDSRPELVRRQRRLPACQRVHHRADQPGLVGRVHQGSAGP